MGKQTSAPRGLGRVYRPSYRDPHTREQKTSAVWWIEYWRDGRQYRESAKTSLVSEARGLLKKRIGEAASGHAVPREAERTMFEDLSQLIRDDYEKNGRNMKNIHTVLERLRRSFAGLRAVDITTDKISAYQARQKRAGSAAATINREMAALKRAFRLAHRAGRIATVPYIEMLQEDNVRKGFFEPEHLGLLLKHLPEYLQPICQVAYITGWRVRSELLTRQWRHIDFDHGWLRIDPGEDKNRAGRMFPFTPELRKLLEDQRAVVERLEQRLGSVIPWLFPTPQGEKISPFNKDWRVGWKAAKLNRIPHDFRRTAVRNLERAGVPRSAAMKMVGHKTEAIYRRYAIVEESMLREAAEKLSAFQVTQAGRKPKVASFTRA